MPQTQIRKPKTQITLQKSPKTDKKFVVKVGNKHVHFGAEGYSDYTKHKDPARKQRYIQRHQKRENWNKSGMGTAGFWSKHLLWNKPTLEASKKDIEKRYNVKIN